MKKIAVCTGTRADYGILKPLIDYLHKSPLFELQLIVTGSHLSKRLGYTVDAICCDGYPITHKIDIKLSALSDSDITSSMGLAVSGFGEGFARLKPDLIFVLGDRYEILCAAVAGMIHGKPLAHIAGGDLTEANYDDAIRHSITKMSHLHFCTNTLSEQLLHQLGENPLHVYNTGSLGIDNILATKTMSRKELELSLDMKFNSQNFLVTYHPETIGGKIDQFKELLKALEKYSNEKTNIYFTYPNIDKGGEEIILELEAFEQKYSNVYKYQSLGQVRYYSMIENCDVVIGNSSSGLYEVPTFKKPTVNIGERQKGRAQASSVIQASTNSKAIVDGINKALSLDCSNTINPFGDGKSLEKIIDILSSFDNFQKLSKKPFFRI